jgi:hypothetical protein
MRKLFGHFENPNDPRHLVPPVDVVVLGPPAELGVGLTVLDDEADEVGHQVLLGLQGGVHYFPRARVGTHFWQVFYDLQFNFLRDINVSLLSD